MEPAAPPVRGRLPLVTAPHLSPGAGRARPEVARAAEQALLPLRPLTLGEVLDVGFLVVRHNARVMVGLPLVVALLQAVAALGLMGVWALLSQVTSNVLTWVVVGLLALLGVLVSGVLLIWLSAVLSRFSLQTVLGDGFAPATSRITWRSSLRLLPAMLGFALLGSLLLTGFSYVVSLASVVIIPFTVAGDEVSAAIGTVLYLVLSTGLICWGYSYLMLAVPCYACESSTAPSWIGRPHQATWMPLSFVRAFVLIGIRQALRGTVLTAAVLAMTAFALSLVGVAVLLVVGIYGPVLPWQGLDALALASRPQTWFVVAGLISILIGSVLPFAASAQTIFYLDLRMRREGLDLALRFDGVTVPQPRTPVRPIPYPLPQQPAPPPPGVPR